MTMCAGAVFHFFHFKVTVGGAREGEGDSVLSFL